MVRIYERAELRSVAERGHGRGEAVVQSTDALDGPVLLRAAHERREVLAVVEDRERHVIHAGHVPIPFLHHTLNADGVGPVRLRSEPCDVVASVVREHDLGGYAVEKDGPLLAGAAALDVLLPRLLRRHPHVQDARALENLGRERLQGAGIAARRDDREGRPVRSATGELENDGRAVLVCGDDSVERVEVIRDICTQHLHESSEMRHARKDPVHAQLITRNIHASEQPASRRGRPEFIPIRCLKVPGILVQEFDEHVPGDWILERTILPEVEHRKVSHPRQHLVHPTNEMHVRIVVEVRRGPEAEVIQTGLRIHVDPELPHLRLPRGRKGQQDERVNVPWHRPLLSGSAFQYSANAGMIHGLP